MQEATNLSGPEAMFAALISAHGKDRRYLEITRDWLIAAVEKPGSHEFVMAVLAKLEAYLDATPGQRSLPVGGAP